jgi:hypothetical protein
MAAAEILKEAIYDSRIIQPAPLRYAVERGGLSITAVPYNALAATASQQSFQLNVPSQNIFMDRGIDWQSTVAVSFRVALGAGAGAQPGAGVRQPVVVFGRDVALAPFPLHSLVNTMTATINDTSITINTDNVLYEVLRLCDYKKNRLLRTCPTMLDKFAFYAQAGNAVNSPLADYLSQTEYAEQPNGAWWDIEFCAPNGTTVSTGGITSTPGNALVGDGSYTAGGTQVFVANGVPIRTQAPTAEPAFYPVGVRFTSTEKLVLPPFIFANSAEWETGLFGINNIQFVFTMKQTIDRLLRNNTAVAGRTISQLSYIGNGFFDTRVLVQYITPPTDLPLPQVSSVQWSEFPRYVQTITQGLEGGKLSPDINSPNIVLPSIPDFLVLYVKKNGLSAQEGDYYLPIKRISLNWDNVAGNLSAQGATQLYQMSVHNGLEMDYSSWSGLGATAAIGVDGVVPAAASITRGPGQGFKVATVGGFLVIKPGQDYGLAVGQAPGLIGNYSMQFTCSAFNPGADIPAGGATLYILVVNSGFFQTMAGSSRLIRGPLSENDILSAPMAPEQTRDNLNRLVGHGFMDKMASYLSKAKSAYTASKPAISALREALPSEGRAGQVKGALGKVGYGMAGGGPAGGRKSLSARLM